MMRIDTGKNHIICGDNVDWLKDVPNESIDLCYIDPPFFSNRNYEVIWGNGYELRSFGDRFSGGISHYIEWMRPRIELIHQKLKKTGSIFLHCDCNASHRLRILLDDIFGEKNFRNFITWKRCDTHNDAKKQFSVITDHIIFYSKTDDFLFKPQYGNHADKTLREWYLYLELQDGSVRKMTKEEIESQKIPKGVRRFNTGDMSSPNPRPNLMYNYKGYPHPSNGWRYSKEKMKELDAQGLLLLPESKTGRIMLKRYLDQQPGPVIGDLWTDIDFLRGNNEENMGYKTQKPVALIKRIISSSCPENGVVLDCFAGAASTAIAAATLNRKFIVGDVSPVAVRITSERLSFECPNVTFEIKNLPTTLEGFKEINGHKFADMVCELMGWEVNSRRTGDSGIDGWDGKKFPIQIKNQVQKAGRPDLQRFVGALGNKTRGIFVAWDFSAEAKEYAAVTKRDKKVEIVLMKCEEIFNGLLIDNEKQQELELLYKERRPSNWDGKSDVVADSKEQKRVIEKTKKAKATTSRGKSSKSANQ